MAENKQQDDGEVIDDFDETNAVVPGLDGDDGGAKDPKEGHGSLLGNILADPLHLDGGTREDNGETAYSEEGRP